ncbi:MAG: membrane protein insertase YidC [Planctomycetota bacterium]
MEKRLPLAFFLCFLLIVVFQLTQPPPAPKKPVDADVVETQEPERTKPEVVLAPDRVAADTEERVEVEFGREGEPGHYRATFTNLGARLLNSTAATTSTPRSRRSAGTWVRLLQPVQTREGRHPGSLGLAAALGARGLPRGPRRRAVADGRRPRREQGRVGRLHVRPGRRLAAQVRAAEARRRRVGDVRARGSRSVSSATQVYPPFSSAIGLVFTPAACVGIEFPDSFYQQPSAVAVGGVDGKLDADTQRAKPKSERSGALDVPAPLRAVGAHNKYFAVVMHAVDEASQAVLSGAGFRRLTDQAPVDSTDKRRHADEFVVADAYMQIPVPEPGGSRTWTFDLYAGPKDEAHFVDGSKVHEEILKEDLSTFSGIGRFLTSFLRLLEGFVGNWGVAIILLTLIIRSVLFPLNRRSQTSMAQYQSKMKRIQPKLEELKKKYEKDPQALRQEQAKLMQKEGAFPPLGGCLPVFLQLPIFFGLFAALRTSFDLRQAPFFGYIDDLSRPDQLVEFSSAIPVLNITHFNLLPILMVVLWILQQRSMPKPTDENALRMQRIMMFMPVVMGVFLYNYAAGLSLYTMTQSTLGIVEQRIIKKVWPVDDTEKPRKEKSGCAPLAKRMQELAEQQQKRQNEVKRKQQQGSRKRR